MPSVTDLSPALLELLHTQLDTLEKLEIALAIRDAPASVEEIAAKLQMPLDVVRSVLAEMKPGPPVMVNGARAWLDAAPQSAAIVAELAQLYAERRHALLGVLSKIAIERVRRMTTRRFADAFHIRGNKGKGDKGKGNG